MVNKILYFFLLFLALVGFIGGIGYSVYYGAIPVGIGVAALRWMAWPKVLECWRRLNS